MSRVPESRCLACGDRLNAASALDDQGSPAPDMITICLHCGHIMAFSENLTLRALTDTEMVEIAGHPELLKAQRVVGAWKLRNENARSR